MLGSSGGAGVPVGWGSAQRKLSGEGRLWLPKMGEYTPWASDGPRSLSSCVRGQDSLTTIKHLPAEAHLGVGKLLAGFWFDL